MGVLLSGGIDSTAVAAMAETLRRAESGAPHLAAFTLLAEGFLQEEWETVQRLVASYGTELHAVRPEAVAGPVTFFELSLDSAETPHHDGLLGFPLLLERAAARGCRVLLTGLGADELSQYAEEGFLADLLRRGRLRRLAVEARLRASAYGGDWRQTLLCLFWRQLPPGLRRRVKALSGRQVPAWTEPEFARRVGLDRWMMPRPPRRFPTRCQQESYRALTRPAMAQALNQIDGLASNFAVECRHPYLDRRLIEFFLAVPSAVTLRAGYRKQFAQRAMHGIVPGPVREREGTEYFVPPMDQDLCRRLEVERMARDLFHPPARVFRYVARREAERLRERYLPDGAPYRNLLWSFLRLELWLRQWFPETD